MVERLPHTIPQWLLHHAEVRGARPAIREKQFGIWRGWSWAEVGREVEALAHGLAAQGFRRGDKLAIICYTSGTTGRPKGVMLSQGNLVGAAGAAARFDGLTEHEEILAYLPMAWVGDNFFTVGQAFVTGFTVNCPESAETVMLDLKEI